MKTPDETTVALMAATIAGAMAERRTSPDSVPGYTVTKTEIHPWMHAAAVRQARAILAEIHRTAPTAGEETRDGTF